MDPKEKLLRKKISKSIRNSIPSKQGFILWQHEEVIKWMNIAADIAEGIDVNGKK